MPVLSMYQLVQPSEAQTVFGSASRMASLRAAKPSSSAAVAAVVAGIWNASIYGRGS